ncbi:hypothetical protein PFDG_05344, partial [Plasmodium falciparum Dd2]
DVKDFDVLRPLFNPPLIGGECPGLHITAFQSIPKCDIDIRKELYTNIVLSGGAPMYNDLGEKASHRNDNLSTLFNEI